jgi:hypothetical protein
MLVIPRATPTVAEPTEEDGSALVSVLIIMLVLTIGGLALGSVTVSTTGVLMSSSDRTKSQAAVDAGLAAQLSRLESGELPCEAASGSDHVDGAGSPSYDWNLVCGDGLATLSATARVGAADVSRQIILGVTGGSQPPTAGGPGLFYTYGLNSRLNSYVFDDVNSEVGIDEFVGSAGVYASAGTIECGTGSVLPGDIYTKVGDLQLDSGCFVQGNAYIGGKADVNGGAIQGSLVAPKNVNHEITGTLGKAGGTEGNAFLGGTFTLNSGTVYGSVSASGTGKSTLGSGVIHGNFRYMGSYGIWSTPASTIVKGTVFKDTALAAPTLPEIPDWQDVTFAPVNATTPPAAWAEKGYQLTTVTGSACSKWSGNSADVSSLASTLTTNMIFDIRACSGNFDTNLGGANKEVRVNKDIAIIANQWYLSGTKFTSADGNPHTVFLITPDGNPAAAGPQCTAPAAASEQLNDSTVSPKIAVYIYTPCLMKFNSGTATFRGQVYSGQLSFGGGVKVAFAPRSIPGYDFGEDVEPWPGSGGGSSELVFTLLSTYDIGTTP